MHSYGIPSGIQEEDLRLGVPVLILRDVTKGPEAVESGSGRIGWGPHAITLCPGGQNN